MSDQLVFDAETAARLERLYLSADVQRRRNLATAALSPRPGERLLDIGCGPGFHAAELSGAVGPTGRVMGVDTSESMLALARDRSRGLSNVEYKLGDAVDIPIPDGSVDGMVAVQVYEYVADIRAALDEASRVLAPGGRLVVVDVDWSTVAWHSTDATRMRRVLSTWDEHLAHRSLPQTLAAHMRGAGFVDVQTDGHAFVNTTGSLDGFSGAIVGLIGDFVAGHGIEPTVVDDWAADLDDLSDSSGYFFSVTKFIFTGTRSI